MKNLFRLLICLVLLTCGSDEDSESNNVIDLPASISANTNTLSFENTMITQSSQAQVIIISAENTSSEINVSSPEGYEISLDNNSFSGNINFIPQLSNEVYVRFIPSEAINYYSTLVISSRSEEHTSELQSHS